MLLKFGKKTTSLLNTPNRSTARTAAKFVQVQGSEGGTDAFKVIECANTVIMVAQVWRLSHYRSSSGDLT